MMEEGIAGNDHRAGNDPRSKRTFTKSSRVDHDSFDYGGDYQQSIDYQNYSGRKKSDANPFKKLYQRIPKLPVIMLNDIEMGR